MRYKTVLCYIQKDNQYLMMLRNKKQKDINKNKYIGVGGHIEKNENKNDALNREVKEETNLTLNSYELKGVIKFYLDDDIEICYVYVASSFKGTLSECDEGTLQWIDIDKVKDLPLWEGDKIFLPLLQEKRKFHLKLIYRNNILIKHKLRRY